MDVIGWDKGALIVQRQGLDPARLSIIDAYKIANQIKTPNINEPHYNLAGIDIQLMKKYPKSYQARKMAIIRTGKRSP